MVPYYEFRATDIEVIHNARELRYNEHFHKQIELVYVFKTGQHMRIGGDDYEILEGEAAIVFPNITHSYYRNEFRDTDQVLLICAPSLFRGLFPNFETNIPQCPIIRNLDTATKLAFKELIRTEEFTERLAWTLIILTRLMKGITLSHTDAAPVEDITRKIVGYISQNFTRNITLEALADELNVSKYYISHTFAKNLKISLPKYLALLRTDYAANLLRSSSEPITSICNESGFSSQTTFNRAFKRIYGMTPREYREKG